MISVYDQGSADPVHAATLAELLDKGYAALTVENIAQRAGVHKTTV